jgi:hypothetical protein
MNPYPFCRKSFLTVLPIFSILAFTSCRKDIPLIFTEIDLKPGKPIVFVAGAESNGDNNVAKCWIDGQELSLTDGTNDAEAYSIFVKGNNTYIAGTDSGQPVYWYNNTEISLPVKFTRTYPFYYSSANAVYISDNKVYIAGNDSTRPVYWENGTEIMLNTTNAKGNFDYFAANAIFASGNDIYVAGSDGPNAVYWKNGVEVYLTNYFTDVAGGATANSIYASGGKVYIVGTTSSINENSPRENYWINGIDEATSLDNSNFVIYGINSVFVSGNNVYIAGFGKAETPPASNAVYWNNGLETVLSGSSNSLASDAYSIYVKWNDVYLAGIDEDNNHQTFAVYWKNGTEVKLTNGTRDAFASSIFVK